MINAFFYLEKKSFTNVFCILYAKMAVKFMAVFESWNVLQSPQILTLFCVNYYCQFSFGGRDQTYSVEKPTYRVLVYKLRMYILSSTFLIPR